MTAKFLNIQSKPRTNPMAVAKLEDFQYVEGENIDSQLQGSPCQQVQIKLSRSIGGLNSRNHSSQYRCCGGLLAVMLSIVASTATSLSSRSCSNRRGKTRSCFGSRNHIAFIFLYVIHTCPCADIAAATSAAAQAAAAAAASSQTLGKA